MADVTEMLEQDHRKVEKLFEQIKGSKGATRAKFVERLASDLRLHMKVEESIVYPAIAKQADDGKDMVEEAKTEHKGARKALDDVEKLSPDKPGFDGALTMLEAGISASCGRRGRRGLPEVPQVGQRCGARRARQAGRRGQEGRCMSHPNPNVPISTSFIDRVKGKAKEIFGSVTGNDDLVDEGRLHEQKADAEQAARRKRRRPHRPQPRQSSSARSASSLPSASGSSQKAPRRLNEIVSSARELLRTPISRGRRRHERPRSNAQSAPSKSPLRRMKSRPSSSTRPRSARPTA